MRADTKPTATTIREHFAELELYARQIGFTTGVSASATTAARAD